MKAKQTVHVWDPENQRSVLVEEGETIPAHLVDLVGDHVKYGDDAGPDTPREERDQILEITKGEFEDAVREKATALAGDLKFSQADVDNAVEQARQPLLDQIAELEGGPGGDQPPAELFDPSADGVTAEDVANYLRGLDKTTEEGDAEYDRVVKAEQDGKNRSTAIPS